VSEGREISATGVGPLHETTAAAPTALEAPRDFARVLARVRPDAERLIAQYPAGQQRSAMLPILHAFQDVEGWVSPEALAACGEMIGVPLSVVESTASFYTLFYRRPVGKYMLQVCRNLSCVINGAYDTMAFFRQQLGIGHLETTADGLFSYEEVECLAACDRAPCMQINLEFEYDLTDAKVEALIAEMRAGRSRIPPLPQNAKPGGDWHVAQHFAKSSGARGVSNPDAPGGSGDASGARMLERLERDPSPIDARPTRERLVRDGAERADSSDGVPS